MAFVLGIDTSNYTTSVALYDSVSNAFTQSKMLLPVKLGECGIRQSDAVFHHTKQLPQVIKSLDFDSRLIDAVAVSVAPRECEESYMPCFLAGLSVAEGISTAMNIPCYKFSHQQGHVAAAVFGSKAEKLWNEDFVAFHVSGGTTEALYISHDDKGVLHAELVAKTLDLNAGQLIDRIGVMLGLQFPCGIELEKLASEYKGKIKVKPSLKGNDCCLSGFENKISNIYNDTNDKFYTSAYTLKAVSATVIGMAEAVLKNRGERPLLFAGGVMSDEIIKCDLKKRFDALFAPPSLSADNAVGIAVLGSRCFDFDESILTK